MQDASDAFDTAAATHRTWMPPRTRTDWADNGYDGDHTIDDLSPQLGETVEIDHDLDDGYPAGASFVSGTAVPTMGADLGGRTVNGVPVTGAAYWSPLRTDSPVYGYDRDIAPVTHDVGLVTVNGPEYVRIFTGQMTGTPVKGGKAKLAAVSSSRVRLMQPVQPPAVNPGLSPSTTMSWVVSWCLYACGLYAGPKIREGATIAHYPMHGGLWRFHDGNLPGGNAVSATLYDLWHVLEVTPSNTAGDIVADGELDWIDGPYVAAPDLQLTASLSRRAFTTGIPFGTTAGSEADAFSQAGGAGRLEAWVKGDATDVNNAPGGSGTVSRLFGFQLTNSAAGHPYAQVGVNTARKVYVTVYDGTNTRTLTSTGTLPTDGGWYFIGAAYDMVTDRLWVNLNGTVESSSPGSMSQAGLTATDSWYTSDGSPFLLSYLPFSDVTLSTGVQANVDNYPLWRNDASFAQTARVARSVVNLPGVAFTAPQEAWQIIGACAQAELAATRCDELDVVEYLTPAWWVREAQQVVQDEIDTQRNAAPFDVDYDPRRIRTAVKVSYPLGEIPQWTASFGTYRRVLEVAATASGTADIRIEQGTTDLRFVFSTPVTFLNTSIQAVDGIDAAGQAEFPTGSYVSLNAMPDGTGTEYTANITVTVTAWDPGGVTIRFVNGNPTPLYLANNENVPVMCLSGIPMTVTQTYTQVGDSGGARGERLLEAQVSIPLPETEARRLARNLLANLRHPQPTIGDDESGITVAADPRRQPGDLVTLADDETGVTGSLWRLQSVRHRGKGAEYRQQVVARAALPICIVGQGLVGYSLVGPAGS